MAIPYCCGSSMDYCGDTSRPLGDGESLLLSKNYLCQSCGSNRNVSINPDPLDPRNYNLLERELVDRWAEEGDISSFLAFRGRKLKKINFTP